MIAEARRVFDALEETGVRVALSGESVRLVPPLGTAVPQSLVEAARSHKDLLITRAKLVEAARSQAIDDRLVLAHLDPEDIAAYDGCHDAFLRANVRALRDAVQRGTCSCDRCKARRRPGGGPADG